MEAELSSKSAKVRPAGGAKSASLTMHMVEKPPA